MEVLGFRVQTGQRVERTQLIQPFGSALASIRQLRECQYGSRPLASRAWFGPDPLGKFDLSRMGLAKISVSLGC